MNKRNLNLVIAVIQINIFLHSRPFIRDNDIF